MVKIIGYYSNEHISIQKIAAVFKKIILCYRNRYEHIVIYRNKIIKLIIPWELSYSNFIDTLYVRLCDTYGLWSDLV